MSKRKLRTRGRATHPEKDTAKRSEPWFIRWIPSSIKSDPFFSLEVFPVAILMKWILLPIVILTGVIFLFLLLFGGGIS